MSDEQWQPVDKLELKCDCPQEDCNAELYAYDDHIQIESDNHLSTFLLPDGYALFERVEPEAITPEALQREGWEVDEMGNAQYVIDGENSRFITVSRIQEVWVHDGRDSVPFHHCETMQDLRALVRMLGGAE